MKKKILIFVLLFLISKKSEAQTSDFLKIDSLLQKGRYKRALVKLNEIKPATFLSNKKKATIYEAIDAHEKAIHFYEKAIVIQNNYIVKVKLGKLYKKVKKYKKSIAIFEGIIKKDSDNLLLKYQLGKLYLLVKQPKKAKTIFFNLINADSENANYSYQLGLAYAMLQQRDLKINSFLDTYKKDEKNIKAIHQLAIAYVVLHDRDSANLFINEGIKVRPNYLPINKLKVNQLFRKKEYLPAIDLLEKIDSIEPNEHFTQKMLARSYFKLKDYENAIPYFKKASKLDPDDFKSLTYLGDIAFEKKDYKKAMFLYMRASKKGRKRRDEEYYGLARAYYEMKEPKMAIETFRKAVKENNENYRALYQLAVMSENFYKDKKIAYDLYKKYIHKFEKRDTDLTAFAKSKMEEIKKIVFLKGEILN